VCTIFSECCFQISSKSDYLIFKGKISSDSNMLLSKTNIYSGNGSALILKNGKIPTRWKPIHPNDSGYFSVSGTTPEYSPECETVEMWSNGPLQILISDSTYQDTLIVISTDELRKLQKITFDQADIPSKNQSRGVWVLPEIKLRLK